MTQQSELLKKIDALPPKYIGEVIDFVGYLQHKVRQEQPDTVAKTMAASEWVNPLLGLGKVMGSTLTLEHFREML